MEATVRQHEQTLFFAQFTNSLLLPKTPWVILPTAHGFKVTLVNLWLFLACPGAIL